MNHSIFVPLGGARQTGIGMVEVLIAILIVSVGFLGAAALQARALSTNNSAMARSMATVASYSILDAMRSDALSAATGAYNNGGEPLAADACPDADTSLASVQLHQWCVQLGDALGKVATTQGTVNCGKTDGKCSVTITFDDSRAGGNAKQVVTVVTQL